MTEPRDPDDRLLRPPMTARRETPPTWPAGRLLGRATRSMPPRARARHFSAKGSVPRVRPVRSAPVGMRRVMVKVRVARMTPGAKKALMTHVRYVARDGAGAEGEPGRFFSAREDVADAVAFAGRCQGDRHHFRLIVNPEDGRDLPDLKAFARRFMEQVETDMGTPIDWVAGAHYDTGRPHLHILLRGKRDDGRDLVLPRDYVSHGLRQRSQELATEILGPRQERVASDRDVTADRFTRLDQQLIAEVRDGRLTLDGLPEAQRSDALRRLVHLEALADPEVLASLFRTAEEERLWRLILPLVAGMTQGEGANAARSADPAKLLRLFRAAEQARLLPRLLALVEQFSTEERCWMATIAAAMPAELQERFADEIDRADLWLPLFEVAGAIPPEGRVALGDTVRRIAGRRPELLARLADLAAARGLDDLVTAARSASSG